MERLPCREVGAALLAREYRVGVLGKTVICELVIGQDALGDSTCHCPLLVPPVGWRVHATVIADRCPARGPQQIFVQAGATGQEIEVLGLCLRLGRKMI